MNIPTAEEFCKEFRKLNPIAQAESIEHWMGQHCIEFAKLHVKAALESAAYDISEGPAYAMQEGILNAYPLENIK